MSGKEQQNESFTFPAEYPLPSDQIAFEVDLSRSFVAKFPESAPLIGAAFDDLQSAAGVATPKYRVSGQDSVEADLDGQTDELGYFQMKPLSEGGFSTLSLNMPVRYSREEIDAMNDDERKLAAATADGFLVVGAMPAVTRCLLDCIYKLTGASVKRDDRQANNESGRVVREGKYLGAVIYIEELYDNRSPYYKKPTLSVRLISPELGKQSIAGMNETQFQEFVGLSGLSSFAARQLANRGDVTATNYHATAVLLQRAEAIIDGAIGQED
jgi:hypothetical protein